MSFPFQKLPDLNKRRRKGRQFICASEKVISVSCPLFEGYPPQIALHCSLCIVYLHWINVSHWWRVFKSMFINGFFKCLKIKSLTYWWSFQSCPGRDEEPEVERFEQAAKLLPAAENMSLTNKEEEKRRAVSFLWVTSYVNQSGIQT